MTDLSVFDTNTSMITTKNTSPPTRPTGPISPLHVDAQPSSSKQCEHSQVPIQSNKFSAGLKTYFMQSYASKKLYEDINKLGFAPKKLRTKLVQYSVEFLFKKSGTKYVDTQDKVEIAKAIVGMCPCLKDPRGSGFQSYYQQAMCRKPAKGYVQDHINNVRKGEAKARRNAVRVVPSEQAKDTSVEDDVNDESVDVQCDESDEFKEKVAWLKYNCSPATQVEEYMSTTAVGRYRHLIKESLTVKAVLHAYPRLTTHKGMIEQDYKILFANNDFMTRRWDTVFASKIISYTDSAKPSWREMVPVKKELSNCEQSVVALQLLPIMLPPRPTKGHRPSVTEAMSSFIQFKQVTTNIPAFLDDLPSGPVQPFVLALGERTSPTQAFLIIENNAVECDSLLNAVDACFKAFYVLDLEYPANCIIVWQFIQELVFDVRSKKGQVSLSKNVTSLRSYFLA